MSKVVKTIVGGVLLVGSFFMGGTFWPPVVRMLGATLLSSATAPKKPKQNQATQQRLSTSLDPEEFRKIVFGETALGTDIRYWEAWGPEKRNFDQVIAAATHKIESFGAFYAEDELVSFSGNDATGAYAGALTRLTSVEGSTDTHLSAGSGTTWRVDGADRPSMTGIAHYVLRWTVDPEKLPRGVPNRITQVGKGALVYDPRKDSTRGGSGLHRADDQSTWEYSPVDSNGIAIGRNPALQILWYLIGWRITNPVSSPVESVLVAGQGVPLSSINFESFITAANLCEEEGYYSDCILSTGSDHDANLSILTSACAGDLSDAGGLYRLRIAHDDTAYPVVEFGENDIMGEFEWTPKVSMSNQFNQAHGTFVDADTLYQRRSYPVVRDAAYEDEDGYRRRKPFNYDAVQDSDQAQKLARLELNKSRRQGVFQAPFGWKAVTAKLYDPVTLTLPRLGFEAKVFRVIDIRIDPAGPVWLVLREDDASVYTPGTVLPLPPPGEGTGYDPRDVTTPSADDWTVESYNVTGPDGSQIPAIRVTGASPSANLRELIIQQSPNGTDSWSTIGEVTAWPEGEVILTGFASGQTVHVGLKYRNPYSVVSARTALSPVTTGDLNSTLIGGNSWTDITDLTDAIDLRIDNAAGALADGETALDTALATERARLNANVGETNQRIDTLLSRVSGAYAAIEQVRSVLTEDGRAASALTLRLVSEVEGALAVIESDYMTAATTDLALTNFDYSQATEFENSVAGTTAISNINSSLSTLSAADRALARRIDAQSSRLGAAFAGIEQLSLTMSRDNEAITQQTLRLVSEVENAVAAIESDYMTVASTEGVLATYGLELTTTFTDLQDAVNDPTDGLAATRGRVGSIEADYTTSSDVTAAFTSYGLTSTSTFGDLASDVSDIDDAITDPDSGLTATAARVDTETQTRATADSALARRQDEFTARIAASLASIEQLRQTLATDDRSLAQSISRVGSILNGVEALVETISEVMVDEDGAVAAWLNRVTAGSATATVEITARDTNGDPVSHIRLKADSIGFGEDAFFEYVDEDPDYSNQPNIYLRDKDGTVVLDGRDIGSADWRKADVLTKAMKLQSVPYWQGLIAEKAGLVARATALGASLNAARDAYSNAVDAMVAELDSYDAGQPDWDDLTGDTTIASATLMPLINTVESTRDSLKALIRAKLNWGDLLGTPGNIADLTGAEAILNSALVAGDIPVLDAGKITTGTFADARVPNLAASKITSGTFNADRVPTLDAAKIGTGTFAAARVPDLAATKITTGTFADAQISQASVTQHEAAIAISNLSGAGTLASKSEVGLDELAAGLEIKDGSDNLMLSRSTGKLYVDGYEVNRLFTSSPGSQIAITSDDDGGGKVIARADLLDVRAINTWGLIGSGVDFNAPGVGNMGSETDAYFKFRVWATGPDAGPDAIGTTFAPDGALYQKQLGEWDVSFDELGNITILSTDLGGNPSIDGDEFNEEVGARLTRYPPSQLGTCYVYFVCKWISTTAGSTAGISLKFSTDTTLAVTNLINRAAT